MRTTRRIVRRMASHRAKVKWFLSGRDIGEAHPEQPVDARQLQPMRMRSLKHSELMPKGEDFELQDRARAGAISNRLHKRHQNGHRSEGYSSSAVTAMVATRTEFLVTTTSGREPWHGVALLPDSP